ncbi:hypothetical protein [Phaeobacter sp. J2-8]|uniref:hypothetical protein n=1 Tax=Phaeobacter sp. J2-8 TaxID=2931394 RepID=UPI001FD01B66|nr:hypothetical protein [Phaeobacter sp. J2-8]MCJ7874219.1 hypothetical protein [Phaeobacter sp. J2-8]
MPNILANLMLALWPVVTVLLFRRLPLVPALLWTLVAGFLLLPPTPAAFDFPLLPPLSKHSIPALSALVLSLMFYGLRKSVLPDSLAGKLLMLTFILSPIATVATNGEMVRWGDALHLPGLQITDAIALSLTQVLIFIPFVLARQYLVEAASQRLVLVVLMSAGLAYTLPALIEVRISPQMNIMIYGYFQHDFTQTFRFGGWRPTVFLYHGIWLTFFIMMALTSAVALLKFEQKRRLLYAGAMMWLGVCLFLFKSLGAMLFALFLVPVVLSFSARNQIKIAALLALLAVGYPVLKAVELIPSDRILAAAASIDTERAASLKFRLDNEDILLERAAEKPLFGWGSWGRNLIYNDISGSVETISDGRWIIVMGQFGWIGFLAEFGLLILPIFLLWREMLARKPEDVSPFIGPLTLMLAINAVELVPNATLTPLTWLLSGALMGYAETLRRERLKMRDGNLRKKARFALRWRPVME